MPIGGKLSSRNVGVVLEIATEREILLETGAEGEILCRGSDEAKVEKLCRVDRTRQRWNSYG